MGATEAQIRIADSIGMDVSDDSESVAAARILDQVGEAIGQPGPRPASSRQVAFGQDLGLGLAADTLRVASAKIDDELHRRNRKALRRLKLMPGDTVLKREVFEINGVRHELTREFVVSSIRPDTRVFFKGGNGQGAWPTQIEKVEQPGS